MQFAMAPKLSRFYTSGPVQLPIHGSSDPASVHQALHDPQTPSLLISKSNTLYANAEGLPCLVIFDLGNGD